MPAVIPDEGGVSLVFDIILETSETRQPGESDRGVSA